jgi:hypothetical protein
VEFIEVAHIIGASFAAALLTAFVERVALVIAGEGWSLGGEGDKSKPRAQQPRLLSDIGGLLHGSTKLLVVVAIGLWFRSQTELVSIGLGTVVANTAIETALRRGERSATDVTLAVLRQWLFPLQILFAFFVLRGR